MINAQDHDTTRPQAFHVEDLEKEQLLIRTKHAYLWMQITQLFTKQSVFLYGGSEKFKSRHFSGTTAFLKRIKIARMATFRT